VAQVGIEAPAPSIVIRRCTWAWRARPG